MPPVRHAAIAIACHALLLSSAGQASPLSFSGDWTQFLAASVAGRGDNAARYGGRLDGYATLDGAKAGLWDGLTIRAQAEFVYGQSINRNGSRVLLPVNMALAFPSIDKQDFDLSLSLVQKIGKASVQVGKINLLDQSAATPVVGGGGRDGFQSLGIAAPPALLATPKIFGALVTVPIDRIRVTAGIWTPENYNDRFDLRGAFGSGVNGLAAATLPVKIAGKQGFHTLSIYYTSRNRRDLADFPEIDLPPGIAALPSVGTGGLHMKYNVQQYLWQDPARPGRGWGLFGHIGLSSGVPDIFDWSMSAGIAGAVPSTARPLDNFGIGYFRQSISRSTIKALAPLVALGDEQGAEIYYTAQIGRRLRLTANAQAMEPSLRSAKTAINLGLRARASF